MSEEFEIESFEDLIDVFENTGDFGEYYLGNYSNIQIANYLRKMQQENKQLKELNKQLIEYIKPLVTEREDEKYYSITWYCKDVLLSWLGDKE